MEDWVDRAIHEKDALKDKIDGLEAFTRSQRFSNLDMSMQVLLIEQLRYMLLYSSVLGERIERNYD